MSRHDVEVLVVKTGRDYEDAHQQIRAWWANERAKLREQAKEERANNDRISSQ